MCVMMLGLCACDNGGQSGTTTEQQSPKDLAISCIDQSVDVLIDLIGEPASSDYAPSCLGEGGEDGNLYYDGFTVYTYREGETETVRDVE